MGYIDDICEIDPTGERPPQAMIAFDTTWLASHALRNQRNALAQGAPSQWIVSLSASVLGKGS